MSREAKGRVAPAPRLPPEAQAVADAVAALSSVSVQAHWEIGSQTEVNGTDFYVGEQELGHIHLDGEAHIPLGDSLAKLVVANKLARRFRWSSAFVVVDSRELEAAVWIFGLRRAQIAGVDDSELRRRVTVQAAASVAAMPTSVTSGA